MFTARMSKSPKLYGLVLTVTDSVVVIVASVPGSVLLEVFSPVLVFCTSTTKSEPFS